MGLPLSNLLLQIYSKRRIIKPGCWEWHLGAHESLRLLNRGFDEFFGFLTGGHQYFPNSGI